MLKIADYYVKSCSPRDIIEAFASGRTQRKAETLLGVDYYVEVILAIRWTI